MSELARRAAEAVDSAYVIALAQQLVRARSVYEPGRSSEAEAAEVVAESLRQLGLNPVVQEVAPGRPNVIADWCGSAFDAKRHPTLLLEGHTDVVTEGDPAAWRYPPFAGVIADGRLHGRGSCDMKGGLAAAVGALQAVMQVAPDLAGRIRLAALVDEEGLMLGVKHFIAQGWAQVSAAIVCEPEENEICCAQKGALRVAVTVSGKMAHGAMPYAGVNPIAALGELLAELAQLEQREQQRCGEHPLLGRPWITPTIVRAPLAGAPQHNVMPADAYLALDIRTLPAQDHAALLAALGEIARAIEARRGVRVALACLEARPATETPRDSPVVLALERALALLGLPLRYGGVPGATDGTFLQAWAGVPVVVIGPGERQLPHQCNESLELDALVQAARLYAAAAILFFGE